MYQRSLRGLDLPQAKLNPSLVATIRAQHAAKEEMKKILDEHFSSQAFADRYGVHKNTVDKVLAYATWRHVR